jgi:hypothetical protein
MRIRNPGFGIFLTLDPGWKNSGLGSGINNPDPQHWHSDFHFLLKDSVTLCPFVMRTTESSESKRYSVVDPE